MISRYLKTLARTNMRENPIVSIIARLLCMQAKNAAVVYRLHKSRESKVLPRSVEDGEVKTRGYAGLRHKITQTETFGRFARMLAKEWVDARKKKFRTVRIVKIVRTGR